MPACLQRILVGGDFGIECIGLGRHFRVEFDKIEARSLCGTRKMLALVPVLRAAPDQPPRLGGES